MLLCYSDMLTCGLAGSIHCLTAGNCPLVCFRSWIQSDLTQTFDQHSFGQPLCSLLQLTSLQPRTHLHLVPLAKRFKASKMSLFTRGMQGGWDKIIGSNFSPLVSKGQHSSLNPGALRQNPRRCSVISSVFSRWVVEVNSWMIFSWWNKFFCECKRVKGEEEIP